MQVELKTPKIEEFIDAQVKAGYFPSAQAAVEAAVAQMMVDQDNFKLTDDDIEAINESEAQIDRGEWVDFDAFAAEMGKKYCKE